MIGLGQDSHSSFKDTWVRTQPPELQEVSWAFISPSGRRFSVSSTYTNRYTWEVDFPPYEVGLWRFSLAHQFIDTPYQSSTGRFDVLLLIREDSPRELQRFLAKVQASNASDDPDVRVAS